MLSCFFFSAKLEYAFCGWMTIMLMSANSETLHFKLWLSEYTMFFIVTWNLGVYVLDWGYLNVNCWSNYFRECTLWVQGQQPGLYQFTRELDSLCSSCQPEMFGLIFDLSCACWSWLWHCLLDCTGAEWRVYWCYNMPRTMYAIIGHVSCLIKTLLAANTWPMYCFIARKSGMMNLWSCDWLESCL